MSVECPTPDLTEQAGHKFPAFPDLRFPHVGLILFLGSSATLLLNHLELRMRDLIFAICTIAFFAVSILYLRACERLK